MAAAAAAPAGATRRFANLLVSKLLRSTPNLQVQRASTPAWQAALAKPPSSPVTDWLPLLPQDASSPNSELLLDGAVSDADSDAGSDTTVASQQALPAAPSEPPPGQAAQRPLAAVAGVAKPLTLAGVQQYVTSLAALQARLRDLAGRSQALQQQLRLRLGLEHERHLQQHALAGLGGEAARCRRQAADLHEHLADMQAATVARKKQATVCAQALVTTLKVMQAASRRVGCANAHGMQALCPALAARTLDGCLTSSVRACLQGGGGVAAGAGGARCPGGCAAGAGGAAVPDGLRAGLHLPAGSHHRRAPSGTRAAAAAWLWEAPRGCVRQCVACSTSEGSPAARPPHSQRARGAAWWLLGGPAGAAVGGRGAGRRRPCWKHAGVERQRGWERYR